MAQALELVPDVFLESTLLPGNTAVLLVLKVLTRAVTVLLDVLLVLLVAI